MTLSDVKAVFPSVASRLSAALQDEKQRVRLLTALGLTGIFLLALSAWLPQKTSEPASPSAVQTDSGSADYAAALESRLQDLISCMDGAGRTNVMVTLESDSEYVYALDTAGDGSLTHVLPNGTDGLLETTNTPLIRGVAVVCEGGNDPAVQARITTLVEALTGAGASHITVAKMASSN